MIKFLFIPGARNANKVYLIQFLFFIILSFKGGLVAGQSLLMNPSNILLPSKLILNYSVPFVENFDFISDSTSKPFISNNPEGYFFSDLINAAESGKVMVYDNKYVDCYDFCNNLKVTDPERIKELMGIKTYHVVSGSIYTEERIVQSVLDTTSFYGLTFWDEFIVKEKPFSIEKKVLGYCPVIKEFKDDDVDNQNPLYRRSFLILDTLAINGKPKAPAKKIKLFNKVLYEYYLYADLSFLSGKDEIQQYAQLTSQNEYNSYQIVKYVSPDLNIFRMNYFFNKLMNKIFNEGVQVYDFYSGAPLTMDKVRANIGIEQLEIKDIDKNGDMVTKVVETEFNPEKIQSIVFTEEWYYDPQTFNIEKKITGISPVVNLKREDKFGNEIIYKKIAFTVKLNNGVI
jgi:hypothetical protein